MSNKEIQIADSLNLMRMAKRLLRDAGIVQHEKQPHCEMAEWLVADHLSGSRATSGNQKGWDVELADGRKVQVKSHAKAATNPSNWTTMSKDMTGVSEVYIVIFSADLYIEEIFHISTEEANSMCITKREIGWAKMRTAGKSINLDDIRYKYPFFFK